MLEYRPLLHYWVARHGQVNQIVAVVLLPRPRGRGIAVALVIGERRALVGQVLGARLLEVLEPALLWRDDIAA